MPFTCEFMDALQTLLDGKHIQKMLTLIAHMGNQKKTNSLNNES